MAMMSLPVLAQSQGEEPIITFHTTVYDDSKGASPKVSFSLGAVEKDVPVDIDCGFGRDFLEVGFARLSEQEVQGTDYTSTVSSKGVVKIYGDPKKIDYFRATGCSIDKIEFHKDLNLHILDLEYNTIKALNIDHLQNLQFVYLRDNPFTRETPLMIGKLPNGTMRIRVPSLRLEELPLARLVRCLPLHQLADGRSYAVPRVATAESGHDESRKR